MSTPDLTVVIVASNRSEYASRAILSCLHQNVIDRMEILVFDGRKAPATPLAGDGHPSVQVLRLPVASSYGGARAEGVRRARGSVVAFMEEHAFALPGWAEALIEAHRGPWAAVGGEILNAGAGIGVSDAIHVMSSAPWVPPARRGESDLLPSHDTSYKREALLGLGDDLESLLVCEPVLMWKLREQGHRLWVEPDARLMHLFVARPATLVNHYLWSRLFGHVRARVFGWPLRKRAVRVLLSPAIPFARTASLYLYLLRERPERLWTSLWGLPVVFLSVLTAALGEAVGLLLGPGDAERRFSERHARGAGLPALPPCHQSDPRPARTASAAPQAAPDLTAILVAGNRRDRAPRALRSIVHQNVIDRMEVLIVDCASEGAPPLPGSDHPRVRVIRLPPEVDFGRARREGVIRARAPVVAFLEEHSFALSGWAEALIEAHRGPWAAVCGEVHNGNSGVGLSDAVHLMSYTRWLPPAAQGECDLLPGHNTSYKRDVLLRYGDDLGRLLATEPVLQWTLGRDGHKLYTAPEAAFAHEDVASLGSLGIFYLWSRWMGHERATVLDWSRWKRVAYAVLTPAAPWARAARLFVHLLRRRRERIWCFVTNLPVILLVDYFSALGQATGILAGAGEAPARFSRIELHGAGGRE